MIGILMASHGDMCEHMLRSAEMITGKIAQAEAVPLLAGESPRSYEERLRAAVDRIDTGDGIVVLVDILGGTPYNTAGALARDHHFPVLTGLNMAMAIFCGMERDNYHAVSEMAAAAHEAARDGIILLAPKRAAEE
ncbi:PTS sugar transporter subunit IIA [Selenomonas felix]|uniref:PTS sugar transporter subunit IIA n=1 Tax=Selenomonas felix TaxID=1944634 RepID=UPI002357813F|nr:PTS sugar transporter subunit IIA [Selenomonas felix]